jgi:hypothetical protein
MVMASDLMMSTNTHQRRLFHADVGSVVTAFSEPAAIREFECRGNHPGDGCELILSTRDVWKASKQRAGVGV